MMNTCFYPWYNTHSVCGTHFYLCCSNVKAKASDENSSGKKMRDVSWRDRCLAATYPPASYSISVPQYCWLCHVSLLVSTAGSTGSTTIILAIGCYQKLCFVFQTTLSEVSECPIMWRAALLGGQSSEFLRQMATDCRSPITHALSPPCVHGMGNAT